MESMLTAREVAELLGVHENWVYDHAASGDLPSYKIGGTRRFDREEIRRWIEQHRENGREPKPKLPERRARKERKPSRTKAERRRDERQPRLFE
jgi:excisionase family DNA binding protein